MITLPDNLGPIDLANPVNRHHPLAQGLVAKWMVAPGLDGGRFFYDLMGLYHATLTNMDSASGWRPTARAGGFGHLLFDGLDDYGNIPSTTAFNLGTTFTVAASAYSAVAVSPSVRKPIFSTRNGVSDGWHLEFGGSGGSNRVAFITPGVFNAETADNTIAPGVPYRVMYTRTGSTQRIYINGVNSSLITDSPQSITDATGARYIGQEVRNSAFWNGWLDDVSVWSRAPSAAEARQDYDLSRQGSPGLLNRLRPVFYSVAAGGVPGAYYRLLQQHVGAAA